MNKYRGEKEIEIDGIKHIARPTHEAMADIETALGVGVIELANKSFKMKHTSSEHAAVLFYCVSAAKPMGDKMPWTLPELHKHLYDLGQIYYSSIATDLLKVMVKGQTVEELEDDQGNED